VQGDGKLIVSANFAGTLPPNIIAGVVRLNSNGTLDTTFHQDPDIRRVPLALQKNGQLLGTLYPVTAPGLSEPIRLVRLTADGLRDQSFAAAVALSNVARPFPQLFAMVSAPGAKTILLGKFNQVNGVVQNDLARLNPDGSLDSSFQSSTGFEPPANLPVKIGPAILQPDGKVLFGGYVAKVNGVDCQSLCRVVGDAPPRFQNFHLSANRSFQALLSSVPGEALFLETSSDLLHWTRVALPAEAVGNVSVESATGAETAHFYRAVAE